MTSRLPSQLWTLVFGLTLSLNARQVDLGTKFLVPSSKFQVSASAKIPVILAQRIYGRVQTNYWGSMWASNYNAITVVNITNLPAPPITRLRIATAEDRSALARTTLDAAPDKITLNGNWVSEYPLDSPYHFFQIALADQSVTLTWEPSPSEQVTGYFIYWGESPEAYTQQINAGNAVEWDANGFTPGKTYYFVVTAYDAAGAESAYSNETAYTVPLVDAVPGVSTIR